MRRIGLRLAMVAVGVCVLVIYLAIAGIAYWALATVWALGPDPVALLGWLVAGALLAGLLSYVVGTTHLLATLEAEPLTRSRAPGAHARLDRLCAEMDLDRPELLVARLGEPNAFAVRAPGRSAVVVDPSLFGLLDGDEFEAVLAHELAHIESGDALVQMLAYSLVRTLVGAVLLLVLPVTLLATGLAKALALARGRPETWTRTLPARVRATIGALVVELLLVFTVAIRAHSRTREFAADRRAAEATGHPVALARALRKIEHATAGPHGPLSTIYLREDDALAELFATHPDTDDRVERLLAMADRDRRPIAAE